MSGRSYKRKGSLEKGLGSRTGTENVDVFTVQPTPGRLPPSSGEAVRYDSRVEITRVYLGSGVRRRARTTKCQRG